MNTVTIVGRLTETPKLEELERKTSYITLAVNRSFKNEQGIYETDFIKCTICRSIAEKTCEYCQKGDVIGVRGQLRTNNELIADKITFVSSSSK